MTSCSKSLQRCSSSSLCSSFLCPVGVLTISSGFSVSPTCQRVYSSPSTAFAAASLSSIPSRSFSSLSLAPRVQFSPNIIYMPPPPGDDSNTSSSSSSSTSSSTSSTSSSSTSSAFTAHTYSFGDAASEASLSSMLTPEQIVSELDKNVIGQLEAKKAVAMALRNRWRRKQLGDRMKEEVKPHNILMIGPTGSGKTEIARRLARLASAPFYKTEMTRYTEVGIYGADVDSIIKDLVDAAVRLEMDKARARVLHQATKAAELKILVRLKEAEGSKSQLSSKNDEEIIADLRAGKLNDIRLQVSLPSDGEQGEGGGNPFNILVGGADISKMFSKIGAMGGPRGGGRPNLPSLMKALGAAGGGGQRKREGTTTVQMLLKEFIERETNKLIDRDEIERIAVKNAEESGIVVLDEIDKLAGSIEYRSGGRKGEGVQKELLSIIEGTVVSTDYGNVRTDHILFIASGAFHSSKPSDLMPELQGRLPIRVQLANLTENDFFRILTETEYNLIEQQIALMKTEGIQLEFTHDACLEIAKVTAQMNSRVENIGARRLNTIVSRIMESISYYAPSKVQAAKDKGETVIKEVIDAKYVREKVESIMQTSDLSKFIL